jgi:hypothetical protein
MGRFLEDGSTVVDAIKWYAGDGKVIPPPAMLTPTPSPRNGAWGRVSRWCTTLLARARRLLHTVWRLLRGIYFVSKRSVILVWIWITSAIHSVVSVLSE